ncbi:protoglobin domain-containing protein [Maricaulis salignorans]|uniref:protoglobin domain-containing protein n=1 Tax=Maricaulis salignorans TaxID=144026 RepID=UPI003A909B63
MDFAEFRRLVDAMGLTQEASEEMDRWGHENAPRLKKALIELYTTIAENAELSAYFDDVEQLSHVRQKQYEHWRALLSGLFDETYLESAKRVGTIHCSIGLEPHAFLTGYASVLSKLLREASQSRGGRNRLGRKSGNSPDIVIDALTRAALLDIGVALTSYSEAEQSKARLSRLKFSNAFRQAFTHSMTELDAAMDSLKQAASELAGPEQATAADQAVSAAELAQSVTRSTVVVQAQLDDLKSKMNEFLTASSAT